MDTDIKTIGVILSWQTDGCYADRKRLVKSLEALEVPRYTIPPYNSLNVQWVLNQLVHDSKIIKIGETAERISYAVVDEIKDVDINVWNGKMRDVIVWYRNSNKVICRNAVDQEGHIASTIQAHSQYVYSYDLNKVIEQSLLSSTSAIKIKAGVLFVPFVGPQASNDGVDRAVDIMYGIEMDIEGGFIYNQIDVADTGFNRDTVVSMANTYVAHLLAKQESRLLADATKPRVNKPKRTYIENSLSKLQHVRNLIHDYEELTVVDRISEAAAPQIKRCEQLIENIANKAGLTTET